MHKRIFLSLILISLASLTMAQNGSITGKVIDAANKEAVIGANAVIQGTTVGASTDLDGNFIISNVKPGIYTLVVSSVTYKTQTISDVVVESGKRTNLEVTLAEDVAELEEVIVTAKKEIATDVNLLSAIRDSKLVVSGISSEQITKLPDRDAAQIAQRVPGITIADNRFIVVRGVPQRYNQVMINGAIGPSTETDSRSFSFDLIPAGFIDQMLIYKSGTVELPGDFAGGLIQIVTKNVAAEDFTKIGFSIGYRQNTTFQKFNSTQGSSTDFLGFDNGFRDLPSTFPTTTQLQASGRSSSLRERAGQSLTNNFELLSANAPVDFSGNFTTSQTFKIAGIEVGNYTSLAYSKSFKKFDAEFNRYNEFTSTTLTPRFSFVDNTSNKEVRVSALHNWDVKLNNNHRIEFKNFFVQLGEERTTVRNGVDFVQLSNNDRTNYEYYYLSRGIYSGQLQGTHQLGQSKFSWMGGVNRITKSEPDYRRFRTLRDQSLRGTEEPYFMQLPPNSNLFDASRFWSSLKDVSYSNGLNFEHKFGNPDNKRTPVFRAGTLVEFRTRDFDARYLSYLAVDPSAVQDIITLPLSEVFASGNIDRNDGLTIEEGTNASDSYTGTNRLMAGYIGGSFPAGKFDFSAGLRVEYNQQTLKAISNLEPVNVDNDVVAPLPSLNVAYNLTDRSLVRVAYSRSINRPEFRELAPFLFYQFELDANIIGSPELKSAFINNIDLRWEMYPNLGELVSVGAFYKSFKDPIELYNQIVGESPQFFYNNSPEAVSYGLELEVRKSLASLGVSKLLRNTSLNLNAALIKSEVDVGANATNQARYRPLTGQSPYIINAGAYYKNDQTGFSANVAYNVFGRRIFVVGDILYPSWFEMPRNTLDLQVAKEFGRYEVKVNTQNLLNAKYSFRQDSNNDSKIQDNDPLMRGFKVGAQFSVSLSMKLSK
ncbi:MAG TPA: TonB-dependent receptor [Cytophagales bacterium]|nr:TonB-dependent receptor [Cytophagales bacterium]